MFELQRLRTDHEAALFEFEQANRAYFARSISDRGDDFYEHFAERHRASLVDQEAGHCLFHVLIDIDGTVVGRFNLYEVRDGRAVVGYRVAERVSSCGVATAGLLGLCRLAREEYGLQTLRAAVSNRNVASQRVLSKAGFVAVGPAQIPGGDSTWYELTLVAAQA